MNDILKIDAVREFYKNSFRPNDPELTVSDILDFIDYMFMFYGKCPEAPYSMGITIAEICDGMIERMKYRPSIDFDGDTVDRELVCEMILDARERSAA